ncbi:MAG: Fe-S cluster assembly protein SufD [Anaerolineae bacterium]
MADPHIAHSQLNTALTLEVKTETLERLVDYYAEPQWMREARREAWAQYQELDWPPPKAEAWRRVPLRAYPLTGQHLQITPQPVQRLDELPPCWLDPLVPDSHVAGVLVHRNGVVAHTAVKASTTGQGVVFGDLHQALHTHGTLIRRYWMQGHTTRPDFNKFTALHGALWHGGTFVYVPEGVRLVQPLQSLVGYDEQSGIGLHHTLVIAERGSRVTLLQDRRSYEREPRLNAEVVEIYAEEGAWVRYASLQHWGEQRYTVSMQNARLARDAHLLWAGASLGGRATKEFLRTDLTAPGAHAEMYGLTFAVGKQYVDQSTYQHHQAPETYSDLLYRNVLRDQARTVFYGMIRVEPNAQGAEGFQANNNLLLDDARAHAIPGLEIIANDVLCSHGATVSRLDDEQLFYLRARAIPRPQAEHLIVRGFLRPIIERVPLACMRESLETKISQRFWEA